MPVKLPVKPWTDEQLGSFTQKLLCWFKGRCSDDAICKFNKFNINLSSLAMQLQHVDSNISVSQCFSFVGVPTTRPALCHPGGCWHPYVAFTWRLLRHHCLCFVGFKAKPTAWRTGSFDDPSLKKTSVVQRVFIQHQLVHSVRQIALQLFTVSAATGLSKDKYIIYTYMYILKHPTPRFFLWTSFTGFLWKSPRN